MVLAILAVGSLRGDDHHSPVDPGGAAYTVYLRMLVFLAIYAIYFRILVYLVIYLRMLVYLVIYGGLRGDHHHSPVDPGGLEFKARRLLYHSSLGRE